MAKQENKGCESWCWETTNPEEADFLITGLMSAAEAGYDTFEDSNGFKQDGFGTFDVTIDAGKRQGVVRAYLEEVINFKNLLVKQIF